MILSNKTVNSLNVYNCFKFSKGTIPIMRKKISLAFTQGLFHFPMICTLSHTCDFAIFNWTFPVVSNGDSSVLLHYSKLKDIKQ